MAYGRREGFTNPNPNRKGEFSNPNRRTCFIILSVTKEEDIQILMSFLITFDGSHDVESILLWIEKVDKLFDMEYILMEDHVEFAAHKLK